MIVSQNDKSVTIAMPIEPRYFGMFTTEGNHAVSLIVEFARLMALNGKMFFRC